MSYRKRRWQSSLLLLTGGLWLPWLACQRWIPVMTQMRLLSGVVLSGYLWCHQATLESPERSLYLTRTLGFFSKQQLNANRLCIIIGTVRSVEEGRSSLTGEIGTCYPGTYWQSWRTWRIC